MAVIYPLRNIVLVDIWDFAEDHPTFYDQYI